MKTILYASILLISVVSASAANYTVKSSGGDYSTIQACASAESSSGGDTCTVYAGTYLENVTMKAGAAGNYNVLTVNPGDTVYVISVTINSHDKVNGFYIQNGSNPSSPGPTCVSVVGNSTDFYITNNHMYACTFIKEPAGSNSTHGFIQGNTMSYSCSISSAPNVCTAMIINGDYHLIENNDWSHVSDGPYLNGRHIVLRKNTMHDIVASDCGSNSSNCHVDFMQADSSGGAGGPVEYILLENNTVMNMQGQVHAVGLFQAQACPNGCFNAILRYHKVSHVDGGGLFNDTGNWAYVKTYNNSYIDVNRTLNGAGELTNTFTGGTGAADLNDIFYYTVPLSGFAAYGCESSTCSTFTYGHSLAWCATSPCTVYSHVYGQGSWTSDPGDLLSNPLFVNYAANNFNLNSGSPAIGAGTYLTTVASAASNSTTLTVADAGYFQDGSGIPGVQADCIRVGTSTTACIASGGVNYTANTLTLTAPISASAGTPVYLYSISDGTVVLNGANPDLGAFPSGTTVTQNPPPAPPTGLAAVVN